MSDYTPTTDEAFNATLYTWVDWKGTFASEEEAADAWTRMIAEVERAAAERAWSRLAEAAYPLYEAAEAVLLAGADKQILMSPLAKLGSRTNPYRRNEGENDGRK